MRTTEPRGELSRISGIGPGIAGCLEQVGIRSVHDLANAHPAWVQRALARERIIRSLAETRSWRRQAWLATAGRWGRLATLQRDLSRARASVGEG